ncbi:MAG: 50S ribosomal protein L11 methyltransferase [Flavobacteriales bacterium]|nr:50S ribosomal protein L11 methyltransferase [Flavobacteriales bacterium]
MNYKEVIFSFQPLQPWSEILVAYLSDLDFESFEDINEGARAYIKEEDFNFSDVEKICSQLDCKIDINHKVIKQENWNAKWESDFQPITIGSKCGIRADFHEPLEVEYEIIITPKMSFGTGHHATTYGMIEAMLGLDFNDKKVLDMGCGTAVLAILAHQLGSNKVDAIDIEEWAFNNALENIIMNGSSNILVHKGGKENIEGEFDIILANINRNILIQDMHAYSSHLLHNGLTLFSGFYEQDLDLIKQEAKRQGLKYISHNSKNNWVTAKFQKL